MYRLPWSSGIESGIWNGRFLVQTLGQPTFFLFFSGKVHNFLIKLKLIHLYLKFEFFKIKFISNLRKKSNFMIFSKKWKEKSCPETGFEPQTFEFKDHCLIHYSTGTMMEARKKSFEVKIISLFVTNR